MTKENPYLKNYVRNIAYAQPKSIYKTSLSEQEKSNFMEWVDKNKIPYNPNSYSDYDMEGFWKAMISGDPRATSAVNSNDGRMHFHDYWKTPYHKTFSNESQWAAEGAPSWNDIDQLVMPDGTIVFDERAQ